MTDRDVVELIRLRFPKHSKTAYSLAKRTHETGVMLCPVAKEIDDAARDRRRSYPENRKNTFRICGRLPKELGERVLKKLAGGSMQDLLLDLLTAWVEGD